MSMQATVITGGAGFIGTNLAARLLAGALAGRAFNMGGGPANTVSLLELLSLLEELHGRRPQVFFED